MQRWTSAVFIGTLLAANLVFLHSETSGADVAAADFEPWGECATMCDEEPGWCYSFCFDWLFDICDDTPEHPCPPPAPCPECV